MFVPWGVVVLGLDDIIERRRDDHIRAKGIDRDPVRSSHAYFVKATSLRELCCTLLTPLQWAGRVWALPWMIVLCPSERFYEQQGRCHQTLVERAWQIIHVVVHQESTLVRVTAWYARGRPSFADAITLVRRHLWDHRHFSTSQHETDMIKIPRVLFDRFIDVLCYAA
jgi:hypothetical protein